MNPLAPEAAAHAGQGQGQVGDLPVHGRRAEPSGDLRSQAAAEQAERPEAAGGVRRGQVSVHQERREAARHASARSRSTARAASRSPTCSRTLAAVHRRHRRDPLLPRRHGGPLGGAVSAVHRPHHPGLPEHGLVGHLRPGLGERIAAGLRRDARPERRAGSRPADVHQRLPAGGVSADDVPPRRRSRCSISTCRRRLARASGARRSA